MTTNTARPGEQAVANAKKDDAPRGGFRLMRYFTIATLIAFVAVGVALVVLERMEEVFFDKVQREQGAFFAEAQAQLARQHEEAARASLLAVHEASHVNLTLVVANLLWSSDIAPFVAAAQRLAIEPCRALPAGDAAATTARRACEAELGRQIRNLPGFRALDTKAYAAMRDTSAFKIKVFDLRGVTVYSSEHAQIGEDALANAGRHAAAAGQAASELTHRDRFSAFERVVENRDLISSYVPVRAPGGGAVVGVFEIYSDVTPFLQSIKTASKRFADITADNQSRVEQAARANQALVNASSMRFLWIVGGMLALLYAVSWLIVRNGQRLIDRQRLAQEQSNARERQRHREKMATLATMAANVAHEVGNPLAVIAALAQELPTQPDPEATAGASRQILDQTGRIATMVRRIAEFATARGQGPEWVDVNAMVKAVCDFEGFEFRARGTPIHFVPQADLPPCELVADQLNEVLMSLLQAFADGAPEAGATVPIRIETAWHDGTVVIRLTPGPGSGAEAAAHAERLQALQRRVEEIGWRLSSVASTLTITVPAAPREPGAA